MVVRIWRGDNVLFSSLLPGDTLNPGDYEVDTGRFIAGNKTVNSGFWLRSAALGTLFRGLLFQDIGAVHEVALGDSAVPMILRGSFIDNATIPWRSFVPDTEVNVTATTEGILRRHSVAKVLQFVSNALYKSLTLLWQFGTITGDGVNSAYAVAFTNNQPDTAYLVSVEPDSVLGTALYWKLFASKAVSGFTVTFNAVVPLGDTYNWYALRYGT